MSVFETAKQIEIEGERQYRELARRATDLGIAEVFNLLADNEIKHLQAFETMAQNSTVNFQPTELVRDVKAIFQKMSEAARDFGDTTPLEDVYKKALEGEEKSVEFYQELLEQTDQAEYRTVIEQIIAEEKSHVSLLQNMIDFLEQPKMWLENAEFNHMEEY